jgi:transcriptional regulator
VRLRAHLVSLTHQSEHAAAQPIPWQVDDAPDDYVAANLRAIIGIRLPIDRIEGKWKLGQNRPVEDRLGAAQLLGQRPGDDEQSIARAMVDSTKI